MTRKTHSFNVLLDPEERRMLEELRDTTGFSAGLVVRQAIRACHSMRVQHIPQCANGSPCLVPHMWHSAPPAAPNYPPPHYGGDNNAL